MELLREADFYGLRTLYGFIGGPTVQAAMMTGGGTGAWLRSLWDDLARAEAADFSVNSHSHRGAGEGLRGAQARGLGPRV